MKDFEYEKIIYRILPGNVLSLVKSFRTDAELAIPESIIAPTGGTCKIVEIAESAFKGSPWLKKITLPKSIHIIGESAFAQCLVLSEIFIKSAKVIFPTACFYGSSNLQNIIVAGDIQAIGNNAFTDCESFVTFSRAEDKATDIAKMKATGSLVLPEGLQKIGFEAFEGCDKIQEVVFPQKDPIIIDGIPFHRKLAMEDPYPTIKCAHGSWAEKWAKGNNLMIKYTNTNLSDFLQKYT